jgi:hypothetical protein
MLVLSALVIGSSPAFGQVPVSIPDVEIQPGDTVTVPVEVGDLAGEGATAYDFEVQYDDQVIEVVGAERGPVTGDEGNFSANTSTGGAVSVAFAGASALSGSGTLVNLQVRGVAGGSSPLSFAQFRFNEGQPSAQPEDGSATVADVFVSLPDTLGQTGEQIQIPVETSNLTGQNVTSYEFDVSFDSGVVDITGTETQGTLSEGLNVQFGSSGGVASVAVASGQAIEGSGELIRLQADITGSGTSDLTFDSFQFNEGTPAALTTGGSLQAGETVVSFPDATISTGETQVIDITASDLTGLGVRSYEFEFTIDDASVLQVADTAVTEGTLSEGLDPQIQVSGNTVTISAASATAIEGEGPLVGIEAEAVGLGTSGLSFNSFQFNEGSPSATTVDGQVETIANSPPQFTSVPGDTSATVGEELTATVEAQDPNGDEIEFSLTKAPQGAEIDSASGAFAFTPTLSQADSTFEIGIRVSDGAASSETSFDVTVTNDPPRFTSVPEDDTVTVGEALTDTVEANDPNGNAVEFSLLDPPANASIVDSTGAFSFTPDSTQAGSTFDIGVRVSDGQAASADTFAVTVQEANNPPRFTSVPEDDTVAVGEELTATVEADDPDGDDVSFSLTQAPQGAEIDSASGAFAFTPAPEQADSTYQIGVRASDGRAASADTFAVTVEERPQARAQLIHNAADPDAQTVDVYFGDSLAVDDFAFRTATPYVDVPAETEISVGIAPGDSESAADTLASIPVTFAEGQSHTVVANGVLNPDNFADNPDGEPIGLTLFADAQARESATSADSVDIRAVHGATDAPTVDIDAGGATLFDNLTYGDLSGYISTAPASVRLEVTPGGSDDVVAAFQADLSGLDGGAATVLASGFLDPSANQDGPAFGLIGVLADGTVIEFPEANRAPQFTSVPGDTSIAASGELAVTIGAEDPDGDELTFALTQAPENASIDSASGEFSFDPAPQQRDNTFDVGVQASDGQAAVDTAFAVTVRPVDRSPIAVDIDQSFGDATDDTNYLLVGLPGQANLPIENTLSGEPGEENDWRAFWDDGTSAFEEGLVEFNGSDTFNFQPGRGFWLLSRNNWTVSREFDPVPLDDNANASIDLHDGWNIISNPLGKEVSWSAVREANGLDPGKELWSFSGSFSPSSSFVSAQDGQAYYFLNEGGQDEELQIPFLEPSGSGSAVAGKENGETLQLDALVDGKKASSVWVGTQPDAKEGRDEFDSFSPPGYFTDATLSVENSEIESPHTLATDVRPSETEGHTYDLVLETEDTDKRLMIEASGLSGLDPDQQVRLYNKESGRSADLRATQSVDVKTPGEQTEFALLVGKASYVQQQASEFVPDQFELRQNYPNPFQAQGQTTLEYSLPEQSEVTVGVYDILGRRVLTLVDGKSQRAGVHTLQWDGQNKQGQTVASGVYFARLEAGQTRTVKMVVID